MDLASVKNQEMAAGNAGNAGNAAEEKRKREKERKAFLPVFLAQFVLSLAVSTGVLYGGYYNCDSIPFPKSGEFGDKMTYYARCCVFPCAVTLFFAIIGVINKRVKTRGAENPLGGMEHKITTEKNVLANTVEQTLLFLMTSFVLTTYLEASEMRILPVYSILWLIGRILFSIGYGVHPKYRTFGMVINLLSTSFFIGVVGYLMYTRGFMYGVASVGGGAGTGIPAKSEL